MIEIDQQPTRSNPTVNVYSSTATDIDYQWYKREVVEEYLATDGVISSEGNATYVAFGVWEMTEDFAFSATQGAVYDDLIIYYSSENALRFEADVCVLADNEFIVKITTSTGAIVTATDIDLEPENGEFVSPGYIKGVYSDEFNAYGVFFGKSGCEYFATFQSDEKYTLYNDEGLSCYGAEVEYAKVTIKAVRYSYAKVSGETTKTLSENVKDGGDYVCVVSGAGTVLTSAAVHLKGLDLVEMTAPAIKTFTYDGQVHTAAAVVTTPTDAVVTYQTKSAIGGTYSATSTDIPSLKNVGKVYVKAVATKTDYATADVEYVLEVTKKAITISGTAVANKEYDGTTSATITLGSIEGIVSGDDVTVSAIATFADASVGNSKAVTVTYTWTGSDKGNYTFPSTETKYANITEKQQQQSSTPTYYYEPVKVEAWEVCKKDGKCSLAQFVDLSVNSWYHDGLHFCIDRQYVGGDDSGHFNPNGTLTRGMMVTLLYNVASKPMVMSNPTFKDVEAGSWYANSITWANSYKVVGGTGNNKFEPNKNITREMLATLLYNYAKLKGYNIDATVELNQFSDAGKVSTWAEDAFKWAVANKVIGGKNNGTLDPQGQATRAEAAVLIQQFLEKFEK